MAVDVRLQRVPERSAIIDLERTGDRCFLAPHGWPLLAIADSCARVLLIHVIFIFIFCTNMLYFR